jgi:hypothetical protein
MNIKWGNNNESLTLTAGDDSGELTSKNFDKMTLQLIEKQASDIHYLKVNMARRVLQAQIQIRDIQAQLTGIKHNSIKSWIQKYIW